MYRDSDEMIRTLVQYIKDDHRIKRLVEGDFGPCKLSRVREARLAWESPVRKARYRKASESPTSRMDGQSEVRAAASDLLSALWREHGDILTRLGAVA